MCLNCAIETVMDEEYVPDDWRETIKWPEITPEMKEGVLLIRHLYNESTGLGQFTGTPLHVYLDDYNCDDQTILWYLRDLAQEGYEDRNFYMPSGTPVAKATEVAHKILAISVLLDEKQRITMVSCAHDNIPPLS